MVRVYVIAASAEVERAERVIAALRERGVEIACVECGNAFRVKPSHAAGRRFCSAACRTRWGRLEMRSDWSGRFWSKVHPEALSGCWLWHGAYDPRTGYGCANVGGRITKAHRVAYELARGPIGDSLVCHRCDVRLCVNPDHLFLGTASDNMQDMWNKGRHAPSLAKIDASIAGEIRRLVSRGAVRADVGRRFGITDSAVSKIVKGKRWRTVS